MTIAGEQDVPLENKQSVEFLKGIAGVESGVASAGGLIDYVTKRPAAIKAVDLATDHRGTAYGAVDLGHLFGSRKQVGARVNLAGERIQSYVNGADGWRAMGAGAADWKISPKATLNGDFEYQHKVERSVSGYQLLGGNHASRSEPHLSFQRCLASSPGPSRTPLTPSTPARAWTTICPTPGAPSPRPASATRSSTTTWSMPTAAATRQPARAVAAPAPDYFFAPDGGYDIYDYRNPGELRIDAEAEAMVTGHVDNRTNHTRPDRRRRALSAQRAAARLLHSLQIPTRPTASCRMERSTPTSARRTSISPLRPSISPPPKIRISPPVRAGFGKITIRPPLVLQDRIHLPGRIQLLAGGRYDSLRDHNYSPYAGCADFSDPAACAPVFTDKTLWLPQYAVTFNPVENLTLYGNYGVLLSLGPQAPWWVDNGSQFLAPFFTRQAEIGAKYQPGQRILLTTAFFHMRAPFFYPKILQVRRFLPNRQPGDQCFESDGHETHDGIELNAEGKAANWLRLTARQRLFARSPATPARRPSTTSKCSTCRICAPRCLPISRCRMRTACI